MLRRARIGRRSRARVRAGGKLAVGRDSLPLAEYRALVASIKRRAGGKCEIPWCRLRKALDPAHIPPRSAGAPDSADHIIAACRSCHHKIDVLRTIEVTPLGDETFRFWDGDLLRLTYRRPKEAA